MTKSQPAATADSAADVSAAAATAGSAAATAPAAGPAPAPKSAAAGLPASRDADAATSGTWLRAPVWQPAPVAAGPAPGHVLLFADEQGIAAELERMLAADGTTVTVVRRGAELAEEAGRWQADPLSAADHADVIARLGFLVAFDDGDLPRGRTHDMLFDHHVGVTPAARAIR